VRISPLRAAGGTRRDSSPGAAEGLLDHAGQEANLIVATALNPHIGYDKAGEIVREAAASDRSIREVAKEMGVDEAVLEEALDRAKMARPHD
jgi:fumarate hydratase class II